MPRNVRDSDDDVEDKIGTRRTRSAAASAPGTPVRRATRSNKQLSTIESSPEDDENIAKPVGRATRSRAATMEKGTVSAISKSLRSRKNSATSDQSETTDVEAFPKRVTRQNVSGTPTKTNLRTRSIRAGSEVKSTPPAVNKRVTRASSVEPSGNLNESVGTPSRRRTRASIVPMQLAVTEEQEDDDTKNDSDVEVDIEEISSVPQNKKTRGKTSKTVKEVDQSESEVKESINDCGISSLDIPKINEEILTNKSNNNFDNETSGTQPSIIPKLDSLIDSSVNVEKNLIDNEPSNLNLLVKNQTKPNELSLFASQNISKIKYSENNKSNKNGDCELVNVTSLDSDDSNSSISIIQVDSPVKNTVDSLQLDLKKPYVKLNKTNLANEITDEKSYESIMNDSTHNVSNSDNVLVKDCSKNDQILISNSSISEKLNEIIANAVLNVTGESKGVDQNKLSQNNNNTDKYCTQNESLKSSLINSENVDIVDSSEINYDSENKYSTEPENIVLVDESDTEGSLNDCHPNKLSLISHDDKTSDNQKINDNSFKDTPETNNFSDKSDTGVEVGNEGKVVSSVVTDILSTEINFKLYTSNDERNVSVNQVGNQTIEIFDDSIIQNSISADKKIDESIIKVTTAIETNEKKQHVTKVTKLTDNCENSVTDENIISSDVITLNQTNNEVKENNFPDNISQVDSQIKLDKVNEPTSSSSVSDDVNLDSNNIDLITNCRENNVEISNTNTDTDSKKNELEGDKNSVPSDVTDADGGNASSPEKLESSNEISKKTVATPQKSPEKPKKSDPKRKSKAHESDDSDEDMENLFQDIPAEEWADKSIKNDSRKSKNFQDDASNDSQNASGSQTNESSPEKQKKALENGKTSKIDEMTEDADDEKNSSELESPQKKRKSLNKSSKLSESMSQNKDKSLIEKLSESLNKSRKSTGKSTELNVSTEKETASPNDSRRSLKLNHSHDQSINKSLTEKLSKSLNKSRQSSGKSSELDVSSGKLSTSMNNSKISKRKSLMEQSILEENESDEPMEVDEESDDQNQDIQSISKSNKLDDASGSETENDDPNLSVEKVKEKIKLKNPFNKSFPAENKNESLKQKRSSLGSFKKSKDDSLKIDGDFELELESFKISKKLDLSNKDQTVLNVETKDKSLKETSLRNSFNKSNLPPLIDPDISSDSESQQESGKKVINKSIQKSLYLDSPSKNIKDADEKESNNIRRSIELMKMAHPTKHDVSTIAVASSEDEEAEDTESSDSENDEGNADVEKVYNLSGKNISQYSDDNVPGDDCRASEEESSNPEDEGSDLEGFIVEDGEEGVEGEESEEDDEDDEDDEVEIEEIAQNGEDSEEESEEEEEEEEVKDKSLKFNDSKSKNKSMNDSKKSEGPKYKRISLINQSQSSQNSDPDDEAEADKISKINLSKDEKTLNRSKSIQNKSINLSNSANKSTNVSKNQNAETSSSESGEEEEEEVESVQNKSSTKNKSMNLSNSVKNRSMNSSKVYGADTSIIADRIYAEMSGSDSSDDAKVDERPQNTSRARNKSLNLSNSVRIKSINVSKILNAADSSSSDSNDDEKEEVEEPTQNTSKVKNKSINLSHSASNKSKNISKTHDTKTSSSEASDEEAVENLQNKSSNTKNKSINLSNSVNNKSKNSSIIAEKVKEALCKSSEKNKIKNSSKLLANQSMNDSKLNKSKLLGNSKAQKIDDFEFDSEDDEDESVKFHPAMFEEDSSSSESEMENGDDSYRIITADQSMKKMQMDCSTPKTSLVKKSVKADKSLVDKKHLSVIADKSTSSKRMSGSLNDLRDSKLMRQSLTEITASMSNRENSKSHNSSVKFNETVEIVDPSETSPLKHRQLWKLVPLNTTVQPLSSETPCTKFLKKSKLNESVPILKSGELTPALKKTKKDSPKSSKTKTSEAPEYEILEMSAEKSKKRKLHEVSALESLQDDSVVSLKKQKKRARVEAASQEDVDDVPELHMINLSESKKKKKKKNKQAESESFESTEDQSLQKSKKKLKAESLASPDETEKKKKKKKQKQAELEDQDSEVQVSKSKKNKSQSATENEENTSTETIKSKKKKSKSMKDESEKKSKKLENLATNDSDDDAPESVGFEQARTEALKASKQAIDSIRAQKEARQKKQKDHIDRMIEQKLVAQERKGIKRLSNEFLEQLADEPSKRPIKRQKLSKLEERAVMPSSSMFSPGKPKPKNLEVEDGYLRLSSAGSTTEFGIVALQKTKELPKKNAAVLNFREKMLARNARQPVSTHIAYLEKQKAKSGARK